MRRHLKRRNVCNPIIIYLNIIENAKCVSMYIVEYCLKQYKFLKNLDRLSKQKSTVEANHEIGICPMSPTLIDLIALLEEN